MRVETRSYRVTSLLYFFFFCQVELFLFLSWMLHKFTFLPSEKGSLPDLKGISEFTRTPAPYKIRAVKRD